MFPRYGFSTDLSCCTLFFLSLSLSWPPPSPNKYSNGWSCWDVWSSFCFQTKWGEDYLGGGKIKWWSTNSYTAKVNGCNPWALYGGAAPGCLAWPWRLLQPFKFTTCWCCFLWSVTIISTCPSGFDWWKQCPVMLGKLAGVIDWGWGANMFYFLNLQFQFQSLKKLIHLIHKKSPIRIAVRLDLNQLDCLKKWWPLEPLKSWRMACKGSSLRMPPCDSSDDWLGKWMQWKVVAQLCKFAMENGSIQYSNSPSIQVQLACSGAGARCADPLSLLLGQDSQWKMAMMSIKRAIN